MIITIKGNAVTEAEVYRKIDFPGIKGLKEVKIFRNGQIAQLLAMSRCPPRL